MLHSFSKRIQTFLKESVGMLSKVPERHYFPIFIIISLYFVVPYSEYVMTAFALLYFFVLEKQVRHLVELIPIPPTWKIGGSVVFFLVMIDDTLFYFALIGIAFWLSRQARKQNVIDQK
tara:strand:- start:511 stop:867 length:357 start_codon:yes stop_codon:yes gene_type:complete